MRGDVTANDDSRFDISWKYGQQGEALVRHICGEINTGRVRIEVKRKRRDDGKFYVEMAHDPGRTGHYLPSGLSVTEAEFWWFAVADTGLGLTVGTALLKTAIERNYGLPAHERDGTCPTKGRLLDVWDLLIASRPGHASRSQFGDTSWLA